ncbi:integrase_H2C2 domain-containing protein [Trichonephila clavipes]|nr:integrase_H2C2 domain-containing protein [Trichonephila clavipes]
MCLYENDPNEIHMLIGADFAGRLLTGEIKQITENLVAIHTRLGWTLMGESGENTRRCETLLSLHVSDLDISELWRLDTIGIKDLGENQSKRELEEAAKLHFLENVKRDHEGRYMNAPDHYKETAHTLLESFYVDNLVCSVNSKEKLDKLIVESQEILEEGKFELKRGWEHNNLDPQTEKHRSYRKTQRPCLRAKMGLRSRFTLCRHKSSRIKNEI